MDLTLPLAVALAATLVGLFVWGSWGLYRRRQDRRYGSLVALDEPGSSAGTLYAAGLGLVGRPDELRRLSDGRIVPVEWKSRAAPSRGPLPSHRIQLLTYCLLLEATSGQSPPFGVLRYASDREYRVPWDSSAREEVLRLLAAVRQPYHGEATPTPGKCRACAFRRSCDARAG